MSAKSKKLKQQEHQMMKELWEEKPRICEVTGKPLPPSFSIWYFHHILSKGSTPEGRLDKRNILICRPEIHQEIHGFKARDVKKFNWVFEYAEVLKIEYNHRKNYNTWV